MGKGGARHFAKPTTDAGLLMKALKDNVAHVLDMGVYETLSRTGACSPKGLVENADLLYAVVAIEPTAEVHPGPLKAAMLKLLTDEPSLNKSKFIGTVWITLRMERITTILYHLRRLANDPDLEKFVATRVTGAEYTYLKRLIGMVEVKDTVVAARVKSLEKEPQSFEKGSRESLEKDWDAATVAYHEDGTPSKKRALKKAISEVSVDEDGFPKMAISPIHEPVEKTWTPPKRLGSKISLENWEEEQHQKMLRTSLGFESPAQPILSSSSSSSKVPLAKRPLAKGKSQAPLKNAKPLEKGAPWFKLTKTNASKPERSYILGSKSKGEKMKLIVEVPLRWSTQYSLVVDKLMQALREDNLTKDQARELRSELCKQYP